MSLLSSLLSRLGPAFKTNPVSTVLIGLSGIVLVVLLSAFVLVMSCESAEKYVVQILGASEKNEALKFLGISMGGVILAIQAVIANKRAKAMENAAEEQAKANQNTEQGQRQERLKNAIEHLGHESDSVRLGGAYELFHLAEDTKELRQTVLDILCAHIRQTTGESKYREKYKSKPSEEIQSLLTLLFVQEHEVFNRLHVNLQESWLNGANLPRARLEKANLIKAYLQSANLRWALMAGADLDGAQLQRSRLYETQLQVAYLRGSYFQGASLHEVHLQGAILNEARFQGAFLAGANFQGSLLHFAQFQGAMLGDARMQGSHLSGAQFQGADLTGVELQAATLGEVQLQGVTSQREIFYSFENRINEKIGKESDLSGAIFAGGLSQGHLDSLVEGLPHGAVKQFRERLTPNIDQPASNELPGNSRAITGTYTAEEAEQWIAEYNEAMSEVPEESDN